MRNDTSAKDEAAALLHALNSALDGAFAPLMTAEQLPRLRKVRDEGDALLADIYGSVLEQVKTEREFEPFVAAFNALPLRGECRQEK